MTLPIITITYISSLILFLISSLILLGICKLFRIKEISYKKVVLINLLGAPLNLFAFLFLIKDPFVYISTIGAAYFIFYLYFKKYYQVSWIKSFLLYITNNILGILILTAIVMSVRLFIFQPFVVSGNSMTPNINDGEYLVIKIFLNNYKRNDVVVFKNIYGVYFVNRIVGLPGEKLKIENGQLYINELLVEDKYLSTPIPAELVVDLKEGEYFVLGDNSAASLDSKTLGPVNIKDIVGKVILR